MKKSVMVSVSSIHGTRHFHVNTWCRYLFKGFGYLLCVGALLAGGVIYHLVSEIDFAKEKQLELESESMTLHEELQTLASLKETLENDLVDREERVQLVSERLADLEKVLGADESGAQLEQRLDAAAITSSVRMIMLTQIPSGSPIHGAKLSSGYGQRVHPVIGEVRMHRGQDLVAKVGTPVYATADGVAEVTGPIKGLGNFLRLQHSYGFTSSYAHLQKFAVKSGDFVQKGDLIAYSGNTGLSTGPHLHYEVRFVGRSLDPQPFVNWGMNDFESIFDQVRGIRWESLVNKVELRVSTQLQLSSQKVVPLTDNSG